MKKPNILKIKTLSDCKDDWCDKDVVMLHACFQLLTDCVENEKLLDGHIDWTVSEEEKKIKTEIETLYNWWKERKNKDDWDSIQFDKDDEMLIILIKIRRHLWT